LKSARDFRSKAIQFEAKKKRPGQTSRPRDFESAWRFTSLELNSEELVAVPGRDLVVRGGCTADRSPWAAQAVCLEQRASLPDDFDIASGVIDGY
jgi:hypothetical protein